MSGGGGRRERHGKSRDGSAGGGEGAQAALGLGGVKSGSHLYEHRDHGQSRLEQWNVHKGIVTSLSSPR